jgi:predicted dehydrogenase
VGAVFTIIRSPFLSIISETVSLFWDSCKQLARTKRAIVRGDPIKIYGSFLVEVLMAAVRLGLIGLGEWARQAYVPTLEEMEHVEVVAVAAPSEETRAYARETFGTGVSLYKNWGEMLDDDSAQAVIVALPNALHAEATEAAIKSGKHVLFEVPAGLNRGEIDRVLGAMEMSSAIARADLELRHLPVSAAVKRFVASGKIGRVLTVQVALRCNWGHDGGDWNQDVEGDGLFPFLGCWYLDVLDMIIESEPVDTRLVGGRAMNGALMDYGWATLRYGNGILGQFEFNLISGQDAEISLNVCGENGEISADLQQGVWRWRQHRGAWNEKCAPCSQPVYGFAGMRESIADFLDKAANGDSSEADNGICRRVHQAVMLCHEQDLALR